MTRAGKIAMRKVRKPIEHTLSTLGPEHFKATAHRVPHKKRGSKPLRIVRKCYGVMSPTKTLHLDKLHPTRGECSTSLWEDDDCWAGSPEDRMRYANHSAQWEREMRARGWFFVRVYLGVRI